MGRPPLSRTKVHRNDALRYQGLYSIAVEPDFGQNGMHMFAERRRRSVGGERRDAELYRYAENTNSAKGRMVVFDHKTLLQHVRIERHLVDVSYSTHRDAHRLQGLHPIIDRPGSEHCIEVVVLEMKQRVVLQSQCSAEK